MTGRSVWWPVPLAVWCLANSNNSLEFSFITVRQVLGIPRVPAGQEVRVMVNTEPAPGAALTVIVQAQQGSRVRTAAATLMPEDTQAEAVFSGSDLGQGEWVFFGIGADRYGKCFECVSGPDGTADCRSFYQDFKPVGQNTRKS